MDKGESAGRERVLLYGDAFLLSAGMVAVGLSASALLAAARGLIPDAVLGLGSGFLLNASGVAGVLLAWRLHGRGITLDAVVGALVGAAAGALTIPLAAGLSYLLGLPLRLVTESEFAGPLALLALLAAAVLALMVWLLVDALRDLSTGAPRHRHLDWLRIVASSAFTVVAVVSVWLVFARPGPEQGEAPIWAIAAGAVGLGAVAGADIVGRIVDRRARMRLTTGGRSGVSR